VVVIEVIFCYNSAKCEANFVTFSVIIINDLSIKSVKAFPTKFEPYCHFTFLVSHISKKQSRIFTSLLIACLGKLTGAHQKRCSS